MPFRIAVPAAMPATAPPPAATGCFRVTLGIAKPAAVPAAAASVVVVIAITRSRAGEPALLVARAGAGIAAIVIVVAVPGSRPASLFPTAACGFRMALGIAEPAAGPTAAAPVVTVVIRVTG